jgi:hypothetical protein
MRYHRDAHNKSVQKEISPAQNKPTGTKRKRTAAQNNPAGATQRTLAAPKHSVSAPNNTPSALEKTVSAQDDSSVTAEQPPTNRNGLENSPIDSLPVELRLAIIQFRMQNLRKVTIVAKSLLQKKVNPSSKPALVFATKSALSKTCYDLHVQHATELESRFMKCEVPSMHLHVRNFDFEPFTSELFAKFEDSHRAYFDARPGAITIHLTLTPSFFSRGVGEKELMEWLAARDLERTLWKNGLSQWLEWRAAQEEAGKKVSVVYKLKRNANVEGVEDREALRMFLLLFDPLGRGEGELGGIWPEVRKVFKELKDKEDEEAQVSEVESEVEEEDLEEEDYSE